MKLANMFQGTRKFTIPLLSIGILGLSSCGDDDEGVTCVFPDLNSVSFQVEAGFSFGDEQLTDESSLMTFFNFENRPFRFVDPMIYYSRIALVDDQRDTVHFNEVVLGDNSNSFYTLGLIDTTRNYTELVIGFGLPYSTNKGVRPIEFTLEHPLGPKAPSMWWSWADGYIFARIEGPTNHNHPAGSDMDMTFSWHVGFSESHRWPIVFPINGYENIRIDFDLKKLVDQVIVPDELFNVKIRGNKLDMKITNMMADCIRIQQTL